MSKTTVKTRHHNNCNDNNNCCHTCTRNKALPQATYPATGKGDHNLRWLVHKTSVKNSVHYIISLFARHHTPHTQTHTPQAPRTTPPVMSNDEPEREKNIVEEVKPFFLPLKLCVPKRKVLPLRNQLEDPT